jgi:putative ABC transport system permease protein
MLTMIGGILGISLGIGGAMLISSLAGWPTIVTPVSVALAVTISIAVGVIFGIYPAAQAAKLDPIIALRHE